MRKTMGGAAFPLVWIGWLGGVALQLQQREVPGTAAIAWLAAAALALALAAWLGARRWPVAAIAAWALAAATLGFASTAQRASWALADVLPATLEGQDLLVTGVVAELPRSGPTGTRFVLEIESASLRGAPVAVPPRISLGWYGAYGDDSLHSGPDQALRAGQRWRFGVRLRQPHGSFNPNGFDLELWSFERGLGAAGSVRAQPPPLKLAENAGHLLERRRQSVRDAIAMQVADPVAAGVLSALAIGDQAAIDREGWDLFRTTGVAHLMSISGV